MSILVVDDEPVMLMLIRYNLERDGHPVITASTGEEAVELARSNRPDLLILDIMLPGITGIEVLKALKDSTETQAIPVLVLSASGQQADIENALAAGACGYVTKPFDPDQLGQLVSEILDRHT